MSRTAALSKLSRAAARSLRTPPAAAARARLSLQPTSPRIPLSSMSFASRKLFTTSSTPTRGIMPDTDDPHGKDITTPPTPVTKNVAQLTDNEYHELADSYLDIVVTKLEELQEHREGLDVEYSAGVLSLTTPDAGIYVINKQPPNKQIWLSSPISGPKRYDYVVFGEGQSDKEGTAAGNWVYMRDGSTLDELFLEELDVDLSLAPSSYGQ